MSKLKDWVEQAAQWFKLKISMLGESRALEENEVERDENYYVRLGTMILVFGFGGFVLWAMFAPLDQGVSASGSVMSEGYAKIVQPLVGGRIEAVYVKDGDVVTEGQPLIKFNDVQVTVQYNVVKEEIAGLEFKVNGVENSVASLETQLKIVTEQVKNNRELVKEGYVPKSKLLDLERSQAQLTSTIHENRGQLEYLRRQLNEAKEKQKTSEFDLLNAEIKAPSAGTVVSLIPLTVGAVVPAGTKLISVVPDNEALLVEAMLPVHLVDNVRPGLAVEMLFSAFDQTNTPRIPGVLESISADRLMDDRLGPYYKARVVVTPQGMRELGHNKIRPGMPVEVFIITGERTMMSYLLKPLLDRTHSALRER